MKSHLLSEIPKKVRFNDIFQSYPLIELNVPNFDVYSVAKNPRTELFIDNIIGIKQDAFDMAFSRMFGKRRISNLVQGYLDIHIRYNQPLFEYKDYNPFSSEDSVFYSIWDGAITDIGIICGNRFGSSWERLYSNFIKEYDVLSPYNMTLKEDTNDTMSSTNEDRYNGSDVRESEFESNENNEGNNGIYGFNSSNSVASDTSKDTSSSKQSGSDSRSKNDNRNTAYDRESTIDRLITRKGNIGNQSAPELIEKEILLRKKLLWDIIVNDLATLLTKNIY